MINQYIRDPELSKRWDTADPVIRKHHQRMIAQWVTMADEMRAQIQRGDTMITLAFGQWIWNNLAAIMEDEAVKINGDFETDFIVDAYLEWGVRNYPITDRITEHTLKSLARLYGEGGEARDPEALMWDDYIDDVLEIAQHQSQRNRKPVEKMNRAELLRWMAEQSDDNLRRMATAVEYQNR